MDGATERRLIGGAAALGVELPPQAVTALARYLALLQEWNRHIKLTAIDDPAAIVDRHFLDSLALLSLLPERGTLVDIGSGAGFPGVVLALAQPGLAVTCVESIQKKVAFLRTLRRELKVSIEPLAVRDEALRSEGRRFDAAVSRATWDPAEWLIRGADLVAPGGALLAMVTKDRAPLDPPIGFELQQSKSYEIGGVARRIEAFRRSL